MSPSSAPLSPAPSPTGATPAFFRHVIVPFAVSLAEPCQAQLAQLDPPDALPHLRRLLARLTDSVRLEGDEYALSMPHERLLAAEWGWDAGQPPPWAAWWARQDDVTLDGDRAWGLISPCHWLVGREHLTMLDPLLLDLSEAESRQVLDAICPLFESEGWTLRWGHATRWYASHETLDALPTASLDRVIGRNPDVWLTDEPRARLIRRLQSEVQMLLYQHPLNDEREASGRLTVNSFWLSGCGRPPRAAPDRASSTHVAWSLRSPLLADDIPAWVTAWRQLDATLLKQACEALDAGQPVRLTLSGERHALTLSSPQAAGLATRLWRSVRALAGPAGPAPSSALSTL